MNLVCNVFKIKKIIGPFLWAVLPSVDPQARKNFLRFWKTAFKEYLWKCDNMYQYQDNLFKQKILKWTPYVFCSHRFLSGVKCLMLVTCCNIHILPGKFGRTFISMYSMSTYWFFHRWLGSEPTLAGFLVIEFYQGSTEILACIP